MQTSLNKPIMCTEADADMIMLKMTYKAFFDA